jgi:hypothetical protein
MSAWRARVIIAQDQLLGCIDPLPVNQKAATDPPFPAARNTLVPLSTRAAPPHSLKHKIAALREQMAAFKNLAPVLRAAPDEQISLTDPDARSTATSGRG